MWLRVSALLAATYVVGCAPEIGDSCSTSVDCSVNGDRICDVASPGGYCTVGGCERDSCPEDEGVCVEFRFEPQRTASSWCMATCEEDGDCRTDQDYKCVRASELTGEEGAAIARTLDKGGDKNRFCAFVEP